MFYGLLSSVALFGVAILTSLIEIEVDPYGWTTLQNTTWHRDDNIITKMMGKPLTGYHFYFATQQVFMLFLGLATLMPYLNTNIWGLTLLMASYFPIWNVIEDFAWFVLNPYFGIKRFRPENIWWHNTNKFIGNRVPLMYVSAVCISFSAACFSGHFFTWLQFMGYSSGLMYGLIQVAPLYHKHYFKMRWSNYEDKKPNFDEMFVKTNMLKRAKKLEYYTIFEKIREDERKLTINIDDLEGSNKLS